MTKIQKKQLEKYLTELKAQLRLNDWTLHVSEETAEQDAWADISITEGRKSATIRFCADFFERGVEDQVNTCVHELLHIHFYPIQFVFHTAVEPLQAQTAEAMEKQFTQAMELMVDSLADVLTPSAKIPPWATKEGKRGGTKQRKSTGGARRR